MWTALKFRNKNNSSFFSSSKNLTIWIFNIPAYAIIIIFTLAPMAYSFYISLQSYDLTRPPVCFIGLGNYYALLESDFFWVSFRNTLTFTFSSLTTMFLISLGLALLLNESIRGTSKLKALTVVPWAIPPIVTGIIWAWIFNARYGIVNYALSSLGLTPLLWLSSPSLAMFCVVIARSWHEITFGVLMLLAGLQSIPVDLYEAAKIDGASALDRFLNVTLPLISKQVSLILVFETMWSLREFDIIYSMTYGGPMNATTVLGWLSYKLAFLQYDFGKGAAVAFILGILTMTFSVIYIKLVYRRVEY
jgi:multiple sugar transport system permease protein